MIISSAVLTYDEISLFVVVFAMYTLALALFGEANISRTLILCSIGLGSFTFTMTAVPGSPLDYLGTTPSAAAVIGLVADGLGLAP